jgi:hypothetical protein
MDGCGVEAVLLLQNRQKLHFVINGFHSERELEMAPKTHALTVLFKLKSGRCRFVDWQRK